MVEKVAYDEFGLFHENAAEYGLPFDAPPTVRREDVEVEPGRKLSALVWGQGEPELVFLHGGGQNCHTWDTVAMALRPRPLVAIDLPGHGRSDRPSERQLTDPSSLAAAEDLAIAIRALAPNAKGVVGMSAGGLATIRLTNVAPELVRKAVLVDVLPGMKAENGRHIGDFINGPVSFPNFDDLLERTKNFNPLRAESSLRRGILHNALQLDDGGWVWRHQRWRVTEPETAATETPRDVPQVQAGDGGTIFDDLWEMVEHIEVPLLLCRGMRQDSVLRDDDEASLKQHKPDAEVIRFPEAGHSIQGDMPIELAAAIADFIP
jgi:pimeloyl-ACP methyl ester carboxylesterase